MYMKQKYSRFSKWILRNIFGTDVNVYKRELREHNLCVTKLKQDISDYRKKLSENSRELQQEKKRFLTQSKQIKTLETNIRKYDSKIEFYEQSVLQQETFISELQEYYEQVIQTNKEIEDSWQAEKLCIVELKKDISVYRKKLSESDSELKREKKNLSIQVSNVKSLESRLWESESKKENLEKTIQNQKGVVRELEKTNAQLQKEKRCIEKEKMSITNMLTSKVNELDVVSRKNEDLQKQLDKERAVVRDLHKQLQHLSEIGSSIDNNRDVTLDEEDYEESIKQNKVLSELIVEKESKIQLLSERNEELTQEEKAHKFVLKEKNDKIEKLQKNIEELVKLHQNDKLLIEQYLNKIQELKSTASSISFNDDEDNIVPEKKSSGGEDIVQIVSAAVDSTVKKEDLREVKTRISSVSVNARRDVCENGESNSMDMPVLSADGTITTNRSIKEVNNVRTGENIEADEFFCRPKKEISQYSRQLEIISRTGNEALFVCAKCGNPVKISKITTGNGESLFFVHNSHDVVCSWKKVHSIKVSPMTTLCDEEIVASKEEFTRYERLKQLIFDTLSKQKENDDSIEEFVIDKKIKIPGKRRKLRVDVYVRWCGKNIVFKLQRTNDTIQDLVTYDEFCKTHNIFIIWVFGSDARNHYSYLLEHNYQNTIFDNHSCVYILDKEAEEACVSNQRLTLKCNWLEDGKNWHYTLSKNEANGILITLADLMFNDTKGYKPFYKGIPVIYQKRYDEVVLLRPSIYKYRLDNLWGLYNQKKGVQSECKYSDIWIDDYRRIAVEIPDPLKPKIGLLSDSGEETYSEKVHLATDLYIITFFGVSFLADSAKQRMSEEFDEIVMWCHNRLIVKSEDRYGIIDYKGKRVVDMIYSSIKKTDDRRAEVNLNGKVFSIGIDGKSVADEEIQLKDGFVKVRIQNKWGIKDSKGNFVVKCLYDEIASFRCRFFGFLKREGLIKLSEAPHYNYRLPFLAQFISNNTKDLIFELGGIKLNMPKNEYNYDECMINRFYECYLLNIETNKEPDERYTIAKASHSTYSLRMSHVDLQDDFELDKIYRGKIVDIKHNKRLILKFPDGKKSYISKSRIQRSGKNPEQYIIGSSITLKKIDFELYFESTVWEVMVEEGV